MNHVERFRAVMAFQAVDRLPRIEWAHWWDKTIERWYAEGLPADLKSTFGIHRYFGLDPYRQAWLSPRSSTCPHPPGHGLGIISGMDEYLAILPHLYPPMDDVIH
ncbi:MAG: hypothetical protein ACE15C_09110 [Phycisphaerae bacterium]